MNIRAGSKELLYLVAEGFVDRRPAVIQHPAMTVKVVRMEISAFAMELILSIAPWSSLTTVLSNYIVQYVGPKITIRKFEHVRVFVSEMSNKSLRL